MREESLVRSLLLTSGRPWDLYLHASWVRAAGGLGQVGTGSLVLHIALNSNAHLSGSQSFYIFSEVLSEELEFDTFSNGPVTHPYNGTIVCFIKLFKEKKCYGNWFLIITLHFQNNGVRKVFYSATIHQMNKNWQHFYIVTFQMNE